MDQPQYFYANRNHITGEIKLFWDHQDCLQFTKAYQPQGWSELNIRTVIPVSYNAKEDQLEL